MSEPRAINSGTMLEVVDLRRGSGRLMLAGAHIIAVQEINESQSSIYVTGQDSPIVVAESYDALIARIDAILSPKPSPTLTPLPAAEEEA